MPQDPEIYHANTIRGRARVTCVKLYIELTCKKKLCLNLSVADFTKAHLAKPNLVVVQENLQTKELQMKVNNLEQLFNNYYQVNVTLNRK